MCNKFSAAVAWEALVSWLTDRQTDKEARTFGIRALEQLLALRVVYLKRLPCTIPVKSFHLPIADENKCAVYCLAPAPNTVSDHPLVCWLTGLCVWIDGSTSTPFKAIPIIISPGIGYNSKGVNRWVCYMHIEFILSVSRLSDVGA